MKRLSIRNFILSFISLIFIAGCKKHEAAPIDTGTLLQQYFDENIMNKDFIVTLATDNGTDLTSNYTGYTFKLLKTDYYHGPLQATKDGVTVIGTWSCNSDYSQLNISLPNPPPAFVFLTRAWRFTKKVPPALEFAPWGSTADVALHMYRL